VKYTTSANRQSNNHSKRINLCKVIIKKAIREFLPNTERGRDIQAILCEVPHIHRYAQGCTRGGCKRLLLLVVVCTTLVVLLLQEMPRSHSSNKDSRL